MVRAERAFGDEAFRATFYRFCLERLMGWLHSDREMEQDPAAGGPIPSLSPVPLRLLPGQLCNHPGNSQGKKESPSQDTAGPPVGLQAPCSDTAHQEKECRKQRGTEWGWGRDVGPLLHHLFGQLKPCDIFLPSPHCPSGYQHLPSPRAQEDRMPDASPTA